ncbi:energy-coupling factor transporter transmembrane component T family protein [Tengunoibacter tsumagoiensis]|uniref:Energy-coupling factor transporter transmembrane protein EcfT n=1 Tax=Tengunoibacter tsumagoiensis TaxID=2014871 RepID=A0A402A9G0_9CHLR|nr:energy-coupling factor transporter transmembrane component T [Tengunoibacter tsumagoiensis]GCE15595.1 energy-coupling factor transporter transmembrane protein EcfT [Tengunoibacter tsumagoiensis]
MLTTFSYIKRDSFVHRLDSRTKIILLFAYSFAVAQTSNFWIIAGGFLLTIIYFCLSRLRWEETKSTWRLVITVSLILTIGNYLLSGGNILQEVDSYNVHVLFSLPFLGFRSHVPYIGPAPLLFSVESIIFFFTQIMRNIGIATLGIIIAYTIDPSHMGVAFRGLGFPDKFAYAIDLSFRFLPTVMRDVDTTLAAQRARGFELDQLRGGPIGKVMRIAPLILPVVIGSILGAEDIINAMELRCFGVTKRSWLIELRMQRADIVLVTTAIAFFVLMTLLNIIGGFYGQGALHLTHIQGIPSFLLGSK